MSGIQHFAVHPDSHRPMGEQFIDLCTPPAGEKYSLRLVLAAVLELLRRPLHPCKHCTPSFEQSVQVQSKTTAVERLYRQKFAMHAELFSAPEAGLRGDVARTWFAAPLLEAIGGPATALKAILKKEAPGLHFTLSLTPTY